MPVNIELCSRTGYDVVLLDCFDSYAWLCAAIAYWADAITMWAACTCAPRYRSWPMPFGGDPRGNSFGDHDGGQVGVGGGDGRHDGRVGDMQVLDAVHPPARVHHRAAVGVGAHAAGSCRVVVSVHARCDRSRDRTDVVVGDGWAGR